MPERPRRVAALIKQNVATIILEEFTRTEMQWITITDCVMTRDLKRADLYFSSVEQRLAHEKAAKILEEEKGHIKRKLAARIVLKFMPDLRFKWDDTVLIDQKIQEIKNAERKDSEDIT